MSAEDRSPRAAHERGLEQIQKPHHPTTEHETPPQADNTADAPSPPGEQRRGGPLGYQKR